MAPGMDRITQAGAVAFRMHDGRPQILLVTARRNPSQWIFPKGTVEPGETLEEAALREAREEAGLEGIVLDGPVPLVFGVGGRQYRVEYFLVEARNAGEAREGRRLAWCTRRDAWERLTFESSRRVLEELWPRIPPAGPGPSRSSGQGSGTR